MCTPWKSCKIDLPFFCPTDRFVWKVCESETCEGDHGWRFYKKLGWAWAANLFERARVCDVERARVCMEDVNVPFEEWLREMQGNVRGVWIVYIWDRGWL